MKHINRDKLSNADLTQVSKCAFQSINNIHNYTQEEQLLGVSYVFLSLIRQTGISLTNLFEIVNNLAYESETKKRVEFAAVDDYLKRKVINGD